MSMHRRFVGDGMCTTGRHIWSPWCCGKTGWEIILFAMVDVILSMRRKDAWMLRGWPHRRALWEETRALLGWWRSCWPLR